MNSQTGTCRPDRITGFLGNQLGESDQLLLEEHLSECSACRESLAVQTAAEELWQKAGRHLRDQ